MIKSKNQLRCGVHGGVFLQGTHIYLPRRIEGRLIFWPGTLLVLGNSLLRAAAHTRMGGVAARCALRPVAFPAKIGSGVPTPSVVARPSLLRILLGTPNPSNV